MEENNYWRTIKRTDRLFDMHQQRSKRFRYKLLDKAAAYKGFCASGADGKNISICAAIISSPGRPNSISKRTNNQLFYSTFGLRLEFGLPGLLMIAAQMLM